MNKKIDYQLNDMLFDNEKPSSPKDGHKPFEIIDLPTCHAENIQYLAPYPFICNICKAEWGKTTLEYQMIPVWIACDCGASETESIKIIDTEKLEQK